MIPPPTQPPQTHFIHNTLLKLGYPYLSTNLAPYFQPTQSRLHLIQWLIATIYPSYRQEEWFIYQKDKKKQLIIALWKVGVMPISKFTKNLDYQKYFNAMLGAENAIRLIQQLSQLAYQKVISNKAKKDINFGNFLHQAIDNFQDLVNQNFDLYGVTFPSKYINLSQNDDNREQLIIQFEKQYDNFYKQKVMPILERQEQILEQMYSKRQQAQNKDNLQQFIQNLQIYSSQYQEKYNKLLQKVQNLINSCQTSKKLLPYYNSKQSSPKLYSIKQQIQNRSIKISKQFCNKYKQYKKIIRSVKSSKSKEDNNFINKRVQVEQLLRRVNQTVELEN